MRSMRRSVRFGGRRTVTRGIGRSRCCLDGPQQHRWMKLARFWWLYHHGHVPEGKRVGHLDGDTTNDDPHNYALMTPGDVITLHHMNNPKWSERAHRAAAKGAARHNRERAAVHRLRHWLPTHWYAVDRARGQVLNVPHRERWQVYMAHGCTLSEGFRNSKRNGRGYAGPVLGWPELPTIEAAALAVLTEAETSVATPDLLGRVRALYRWHGWGDGPAKPATMNSTLYHLRSAATCARSAAGVAQPRTAQRRRRSRRGALRARWWRCGVRTWTSRSLKISSASASWRARHMSALNHDTPSGNGRPGQDAGAGVDRGSTRGRSDDRRSAAPGQRRAATAGAARGVAVGAAD